MKNGSSQFGPKQWLSLLGLTSRLGKISMKCGQRKIISKSPKHDRVELSTELLDEIGTRRKATQRDCPGPAGTSLPMRSLWSMAYKGAPKSTTTSIDSGPPGNWPDGHSTIACGEQSLTVFSLALRNALGIRYPLATSSSHDDDSGGLVNQTEPTF